MGTLALDLRPASRADLSALDALFAESYPRLLRPHYPPSVMVTAVPRLARANPALIASGRYLVAETAGGRLVGAGGWSPRGAGGAEVRALLVDHRFQRRGIGARLLARIAAEAAAAGAVGLDTLAARGAEPFYRAQGFAPLAPLVVTLAPGIAFPVLAMRRAP